MPNTEQQLSEISRILAVFSVDAHTSAANGRTDRAKELERIVGRVLNVVLDANLADQNRNGPTFPAIDLGDPKARIAVQVTIRSDREKVKDALNDFLKNHMEETFNRLIVMMFVDKVNFRGEITADEKYADRKFTFRSRDDVWDLALLESKIERLDEDQIDCICTYLTEQAVVYCQPAVRKPVHQLPGVPAPSASFIAGSRDKELAELKERLSPDLPIFLWGVGGIGKTEVAIALARKFAPPEGAYFLHYYDTREEALRETILRANFTGYTYNKPDNDHRDQEYKERMDILSTEYPGALLVIDNFDCKEKKIAELMAEPAYRELTAMGIQLVFTTRSPVKKQGYGIVPLDEKFLLTLMRENLDGMELSDDELRQLIEAVEGHTLMVVLMARTLTASRGNLKASDILMALRESRMNSRSFREVSNTHNSEYLQARIYDHMKALFKLSDMNDTEKDVLRWATLLPEDGMDAGLFQSCLKEEKRNGALKRIGIAIMKWIGSKPRKQADYLDTMNSLIDRGWLALGEKNLLTIHPVVREVCWEELKPTDANCENFLDRLDSDFDKNKYYDAEKFAQIAKCFSMASDKLADAKGTFALRAGWFWNRLGQAQTALRYNLRMVEKWEKNSNIERRDLATSYNNVGITYGDLGDHKKALEYMLKALGIWEKVLPADHPGLAASYNNVGSTYGDLGDHSKALEYKKKALAIWEKVLPPAHPSLATSYNNVGSTYGDLGDHSKALEYKQKALGIWEKVLPPEHPSLAASYNNVGYTYGDLGDHSKALEYQLKALTIREKVLPPDHPDLAASYNNVGSTYDDLGDHSKALEYDLKALTIREKALPPAHPSLATSYNNIGVTYANLAQYSRAAEYLEKALAIRKKSLPENHPHIASAERNLEGIRFMAMHREAGSSPEDRMKGEA